MFAKRHRSVRHKFGKHAVYRKRAFSKKRHTFKARHAFKARSFKRKFTRRAYSRSRFNASAKKVAMKASIGGNGDQSLVMPFLDNLKLTNATNANSDMLVWAENNIAGSSGLATTIIPNLCLDAALHLNMMFTNAASRQQAIQGVGAAQQLDDQLQPKIIRKIASCEARIVNAETSNVCVWEYRCAARRDITTSLQNMLVSIGTVQQKDVSVSGSTIQPSQTAGNTVAPAAISGSVCSVAVGVTPFMWNSFCNLFKITKVRKRELAPGRVWRIRYSQKKPRLFQWNNVTYTPTALSGADGSTAGMYKVRKGQRFSLFMAQGTWAASASANANFKVGLSNVNLGIEYSYAYHYSFMANSGSTATDYSQVPGFNSATANVPLPLLAVQPLSAIAVGAGAAGSRAYESSVAIAPSVGVENLDFDQVDV